MARYKQQYRSSSSIRRWHWIQSGTHGLLLFLSLCAIGGLLVLAIYHRGAIMHWIAGAFSKKESEPTADTIYKRLCREEIPLVSFRHVRYSDFFHDLNDVQLVSAQRWGLNESPSISELENSEQVWRIATTSLYVVDSMSFSRPYLVPAAFVMLQYIGERFAEILSERKSDAHSYRPIVTSALRTEEDVRRLQRCNRNATDNSCHCYGTTIDITYTRFMRDDGVVVQYPWLTQLLAQALYELRYEGICHVRYEVFQPCFHITVRNVEYLGGQPYTCRLFEPIRPIEGQGLSDIALVEESFDDMGADSLFSVSDTIKSVLPLTNPMPKTPAQRMSPSVGSMLQF
ncbi:MAG: hypothetical protein IJ764_06920 [Bacteroidales bacterium]|nr:hypothetical protein [Bacteroidales bacterium]